MKQTIEIPDFVMQANNYPSNELEVYKRKNKIILIAKVDGCGAEFEIDKEDLN